jgi:ankyrin repeat protein
MTLLYDICKSGDLKKVERVIAKCNPYDYYYGLQAACLYGHKAIIDFLISKGADDWNAGLHSACMGGHKDIIEFLINKGANNLNRGLSAACFGGHKDTVELMIEKGANDLDSGLSAACEGGHRDIVELIISKGVFDLYGGLIEACYVGHYNIVELLVNKGASDWNMIYKYSCKHQWKDLIVQSCYRVSNKLPKNQYDLREILTPKTLHKTNDIHVKMYDKNLFK